MTAVKWIKLSVNMFDDEKIKLIKTMPEGDKIIVIWVQLLCLAGKTNDGGLVYMGQNMAYTDEMLATIFDENLNIVRIALNTLEQFGMIEIDNHGRIEISNWEKHQNVEGLERIRKNNAERQQIYYYRKKLKEIDVDPDHKEIPDDAEGLKEYYNIQKENLTLGLTSSNGTDIELEEDIDKELDKDKDQEKDKKNSARAEPSIPYKKIIDYLNQEADRQFSHVADSNRKLIKARWNELKKTHKNITEEELLNSFKKVIDNKVADAKDPKHFFDEQYLRPSTLFRGSNFDDYLNQPPRKKNNENDPNRFVPKELRDKENAGETHRGVNEKHDGKSSFESELDGFI